MSWQARRASQNLIEGKAIKFIKFLLQSFVIKKILSADF